MYRVLLADDEGIMLESLKTIIESQYRVECEIETAKTGRAVVEIAESFRPDIIFMDIQMPGLNGIQAMKEIRTFNSAAIFIVITAYDKFDYAKEAINLGVLEYLTKPVRKQVILDVLAKAMRQVEQERKKRSENLKIKERLETVIPIIESSFISFMILQEDFSNSDNNYKELLDIQEDYGFIMTVQFGELEADSSNDNLVGMSVRAQSFYGQCREIIGDCFHCIIGPVMANKIMVFVPWEQNKIEYEDRIQIIERARSMVKKLGQSIDAKFRVGIGLVKDFSEIRDSYQESIKALKESHGSVGHASDLAIIGDYVDDYPIDLEKQLFSDLARGSVSAVQDSTNTFFDWMIDKYPMDREAIQLKVLEFVMEAEKQAFNSGRMNYGFHYRKDYLSSILAMNNYESLRTWFLEKMLHVCHSIANSREEQSESIIERAKNYINQNFQRDISLDEVSKIVDISPYYFSKLFKEETEENFIEYLTRIRMENAKKLLRNSEMSIKEICIESGYSDPNYFSRIFKKYEEITPSEYRERLG